MAPGGITYMQRGFYVYFILSEEGLVQGLKGVHKITCCRDI